MIKGTRIFHVLPFLFLGLAFFAFRPVTARATGATPLKQAVLEGKHLFFHDTFGGRGMTCDSCHQDGGRGPTVTPGGSKFPSLTNAAAIFPRYSKRAGKVITLEDQIVGCIRYGLGGNPPASGSRKMSALVSYLTSLSQGMRVDMGGKPR